YVEQPNIVGLRAVVALRLHIDLPLPSKSIEIVDEESTHKRLDGPVHFVDRHALLESLVAIDEDELLRHTWQEGGAQTANLRSLSRCGHELGEIGRQELHVAARRILEYERESSRRSNAGNRRRRKSECDGVRECREFLVDV